MGKCFFLSTFPFARRFLEGRVCWVRPSLVGEYSKGGNKVSVKSPATGKAGNASSIIGAQGRRCMRFVHFQVPLEDELRAGIREGMMSFQ